MHAIAGCGPVLVWRHCDMLYAFGFVDEIMFAYCLEQTTRKYAQCDSPGGSTDLSDVMAYSQSDSAREGIVWSTVMNVSVCLSTSVLLSLVCYTNGTASYAAVAR